MIRIPGNAWALQQAKHNLFHKYLLVGVTEDLNGFINVLEAALPKLFKGAIKRFLTCKYKIVTFINKFIAHSI